MSAITFAGLLLLGLAVGLVLGIVWLAFRWLGRGAEPPWPMPEVPARVRPWLSEGGLVQHPVACPECGIALPENCPHGLCPRCLLQAALSMPAPAEDEPPATNDYPAAFTAPEPAALAPHFPQLEIQGLIGQGGMGAVYRARQLKLDRLVALKVLPAEWGRDPAFAERFAREARALARLSHPHVVAIHDFGEAGGHFYLVMEYVDGVNLRQLLRTGPLAPELALQIVPQICEALQYAHEEGVVHRDIKPENILLDRRGRVRIADFGLAKLVGPSRASFTLTGTRQVMGTLDYMAPEQRQRPQDVDHRADIYSLGVVLYEMLTGELPLGRFAPPSQVAGVGPQVDEIVFHALECEPEQRYQRVSEVKADLDALSGGQAQPVVRAGEVPESVQLLVLGPATALMASGIVALIAGVAIGLGVLITLLIESMQWAERYHQSFTEYFLRLSALEGVTIVACVVLGVVVFLWLVALVLQGARNLRRFQHYDRVVMALIVAMIPFIHAIIGIPAAIWCGWALSRPEVRAAFAANMRRQNIPPSSPGRPTPAPGTGPVRGLLRSVGRMFFTSPAREQHSQDQPG